MSKQEQGQSFDQQIGEKLVVTPNMKLSVVWRQLDSAINQVFEPVAKRNAALAKTLPVMKKQQFLKDLQGVREGKYIKFPDGSQARY